jgi:hypothetical protein
MYQCLFLRLTIRVKIRIKTKKQQFGWNQIVCFHLFRILSKKNLGSGGGCVIYFIQCICCSVQAPSVLQVVNCVGPLSQLGKGPWLQEGPNSVTTSRSPLELLAPPHSDRCPSSAGPKPGPPSPMLPICSPSLLSCLCFWSHRPPLPPRGWDCFSCLFSNSIPWVLWCKEIMSVILNIITYGCWIHAQV